MSNALLALLYSSASSASASSSSAPATPPVQAEQQQQLPAPSNSITATSSTTAPVEASQPASASISASNSLLALLTPPAVPATTPAQQVAPPQSSSATTNPAPPSSSSAAPFSLLDALNKPSRSSASPQPPGPPPPFPLQLQQQQQPPPPPSSAPPTANSLLAALFNPTIGGSSTTPRTPPTPSPAPPPAPQNVPVPAPPSQMDFLTSLQTPSPAVIAQDAEKKILDQGVPPLLQAILTPSRESPAPVPSSSSAESKAKVPDAPEAVSAPAQPAQPALTPIPTAQPKVAAPTTVEPAKAKEGPVSSPEDKKKDIPKSNLRAYVQPKSSRDRLPVQRAMHTIMKLVSTMGTSFSDPRTAGLTLFPPIEKQTKFHIDLTRLQPAGIDTLFHEPLQATGIALFPQAQAQAQAQASGGGGGSAKNFVTTLPSPIPSTSGGLRELGSRNAGAIVLYTLSRARIRVVHRETGARAMLSPPPTSSFALSPTAKVIRLVSGYSGNTSLLVVAAIIQDGLRVEEGGSSRGKVEYYLCGWGLNFHFGRVLGEGEGAAPDTEVRTLVFASLPATIEIDQDVSKSLAQFPPPALVWEADAPKGVSVGAYGSLLLRTAGQDAQLWRVDIERCECRTGFALEVLQKGKGAARLGPAGSHSVFAPEARSNAPVLANCRGGDDEVEIAYLSATASAMVTGRLKSKLSGPISFFAALPGVEGQRGAVAIVGLERNTRILIIRLASSSAISKSSEFELLASWVFDAPPTGSNAPESSSAGNILSFEAEHTQTLVLAQPDRTSIFVLPLEWVLRDGSASDVVPSLRWTECVVPEPIVDFVLDAVPALDDDTVELALTASYAGGVHIVKIPTGVLKRRAVVSAGAKSLKEEGDKPVEAEADSVDKIAEQLSRTAIVSDSSAVAAGMEKAGATEPDAAVSGEQSEARQADAPAALAVSSTEAPGSEADQTKPVAGNDAALAAPSATAVSPALAEKDIASSGVPASVATVPQAPASSVPLTVLVAPTPQRVGSPAKGRAAKVAAAESGKAGRDSNSSRSRTGSQVKKDDATSATAKTSAPMPLNGSGAGAGSNGTSNGNGVGNVDLGPIMSLLKQQVGQVLLPEVKSSTRQAVQEYMGNTLPEAVLAALPHELHRFLLRPDLSAHLIRTITTGILPDVRRTAVDTVTKVLAPEFEDVFRGVESRLLGALESEMVNLRKEVVAEQGDALVQTEGLVKDMSARMAELRSAVLGLNAANARMEKVLLRMFELEERREAEHADERARLLELVKLQQRKMESMEASFGQQVGKMQGALEEHRSELKTILQQQQQQQQFAPPPQQPRRSGHEEWGMVSGPQRSWGPPSVLSPPPPPPPSGSYGQFDMSQGPPAGPEYFFPPAPPPPSASSSSFPPVMPPPGPYGAGGASSSTPIPQPPRPIPEKVEDALIQALGAPGIEQDPAPLRETLQTLQKRHGSIRDVLVFPPTGPMHMGDAGPDEVSQPVLLALVHRLTMALDARAQLGPNPPASLVMAGAGGALDVKLAVPWLEVAAPRLNASDPSIEKQYHAVVALIREALWRAVQGLKGGPDGWWDEARAKEHVLNYLWAQK
ncbi:hypothetical protein A4X09_0g3773 [Tilletia walkeri]|uniref:Uncharacterized protein n=1 Tax=Tilletia walkeri TaxID=117179 RepID=A0A8X7NAN9_9BASI|nr:hypothetical protein A4X09_0g3773 [Tilletia walkeri]